VAISARRSHVLLGAVLAVFAVGAEETSTIEIAVSVEPPVEAAGLPAQVLVGFASAGGGFLVFRVGFVCTPDARFSSTVTFQTSAAPTAVDAFLVPVERGAAFACGPATPQAVSPSAPLGPAQASAGLHVAVGCGAGDVRTATLVIGGSS
jgi:hypothetical protein